MNKSCSSVKFNALHGCEKQKFCRGVFWFLAALKLAPYTF